MSAHNKAPSHTMIFDQQPWLVRAIRGFWRINPFVIFGATFLLGLLPLIYSVLVSPIGSVAYYMPTEAFAGHICNQEALAAGECIEKQVGYGYAINWWPTLAILMPFALFFAFLSVQNMQQVFGRMLNQGMFCARDWSAPINGSGVQSGLRRLVQNMWMTFAVAGFCVLVVVTGTLFLDWYCVVHSPLEFQKLLTHISPFDRPEICKNVAGQELDWSISAIFALDDQIVTPDWVEVPEIGANWLFSTYVYALLVVELCLLLTYFCFVFALAVTVWRLRQGRTELRLIPNLKSGDRLKRMGFENFEPVLQPCIFVTILSFIMAFLMRLQNEYLRSDEPGAIFSFMLSGIDDIVSGDGGIKNVALLFDTGKLADPNSQIGGPAVIAVFALISVILAFILRRTALEAASNVHDALHDDTTKQKVLTLYNLPTEELETRLSEIAVWPLSWPQLRQMLILTGGGIASFFFYKFAIAWIVIVLLRLFQAQLGGKK